MVNLRLKDLPIVPDDSGLDRIGNIYTSERNKVRSQEDLRKFVKRWRAIWGIRLRGNDKELTSEEFQLIECSFDIEAAWNCLSIYRSKIHLREHRKKRIRKKYQKNQPHCGHTRPSCFGMHIMLPPNLLHAYLIGNHYGVSVDIALIQAAGGFGELPGYGQPLHEANELSL